MIISSKSNNFNLSLILLILVILGVILVVLYMITHPDNTARMFSNEAFRTMEMPVYEKDRTKLYGSLFLDDLNTQIKRLTDPRIEYDSKRLEINRYHDILL